MLIRPRRNRKTEAIRSILEETTLLKKDLVMPYFLIEGSNRKEDIKAMPKQARYTLDLLLQHVEKQHEKGLKAIALFPCLDSSRKDLEANESFNPEGLIPQAVRKLKQEFPSLCIITDVALDPFTSHGHDGIVNAQGEVLNDETIAILEKMALVQAEAGVDMVAPSDMMDGRVKAIRQTLDKQGFIHTSILSYTAKYASSLYGPFRDAVGSTLKFGDKKTYQMNPANVKEALLEACLDEEEGADILMVKPALYYLDIIKLLSEHSHRPIAAYHVSGEYSMVMAAAQLGYLDEKKVFLEALLSIKRAGAKLLFSYASEMLLDHLP